MKTNLTLKFTFLFLLLCGATNIGLSQAFFEITSPASVVETYPVVRTANWGQALPDCINAYELQEEIIIISDDPAADSTGVFTDGCEMANIDLTGKIALVDRGACNFSVKALNAQNAGAVGVIICNNNAGTTLPNPLGAGYGSDMVTIPVWGLEFDQCAAFRGSIPTVEGRIFYETPPAGTDVILWDGGQFDGGLDGWTTQWISDTNAEWVWSAQGVVAGPLTGGLDIASPTVCNGAMVFDSDFLNTGVSGAPPYPMHTGELISPTIDCSAFPAVSLKFHQHLIKLNGSASFAYSLDDGNTWSPNVEIETGNVLTGAETILLGTEIQRYFLPDLAGEPTVRIKFTWDGDFYFMIIDDVQLIAPEANNLVLMSNFYAIAPNAMWPESQLEGYSHLADIANVGAAAQPNTTLNVSVTDNGSGAVVFTDDNIYGLTAPDSLFENDPFPGVFTPPGPAGTNYTGTYTLASDSIDFDPSDNTISYDFMVSDSTFAKEVGPTNTVRPADATWEDNEPHSWGYGNYYHIVNGTDASTPWYASSVSFGVTDLNSGEFVTVRLYSVADDNGNNDIEPEERQSIASALYLADGTEDGSLITLPLSPDDPDNGVIGNIELFSDQGYLVMVEYVTAEEGTDCRVATADMEYSATAFRTNQSEFGDVPYRPSGVLSLGNPETETFINGSFTNFIPAVRLTLAPELPNNVADLDPANVITVTPNPADSYFNLNVDLVNTQERVLVNIVDVTGKTIQSINYENVSNETFKFNTNNLAVGTYFLNFITEEGVRTERFIIQR